MPIAERCRVLGVDRSALQACRGRFGSGQVLNAVGADGLAHDVDGTSLGQVALRSPTHRTSGFPGSPGSAGFITPAAGDGPTGPLGPVIPLLDDGTFLKAGA